MKRIAAIILALSMIFTLAACGVQSSRRPSTTTDITQADIDRILAEIEDKNSEAE